MNKTLNVRYLVRLLVIFAVVAGTVHLVHRRQARIQANAFLHQADSAEQSRDFSRTAQYLRAFLVFRPDNTDVRARLGLLMAQTARTAEQKFKHSSKGSKSFARTEIGPTFAAGTSLWPWTLNSGVTPRPWRTSKCAWLPTRMTERLTTCRGNVGRQRQRQRRNIHRPLRISKPPWKRSR